MNKCSTENKDWFKDRGYLHLTNQIKKRDKLKLEYYLKSSILIEKHRFSPFILRQTNTRRYKYSEELQRRSHKAVDDKGNIASNAKMRPIMYATHIDAHIYSYYSHKKIQPAYEAYLKKNELLDQSVTAYRQILSDDGVRYKYNVDFAKDVFDEIKRRENCAVLAFDIKNFFPTLNHKQLKKIWSFILGTKSLPKDHYAIYKSITNYSYFYYDDLRKRRKGHLDEKKIAKLKNEGKFQFFEDYNDFKDSGIQVYKNQTIQEGHIAGIPQGLPISAMLANLYMLPFDESIVEHLVRKRNCYYRRYSDDLVVVCNTEEIDEVEAFVNNAIAKIKLTISPAKTEKFLFKRVNGKLKCHKLYEDKVEPNAYLQYLGFDFYGDKVLIKSANVSRFYREMKESIRMKSNRVEAVQKKYLTQDAIIFKRKLLRLYSFKGIQSRDLPANKVVYKHGKLVNKRFTRRYRGNFIKYAYRASEIMEAPEIKRQLRRHMIVLKQYMKRYNFDNIPQE